MKNIILINAIALILSGCCSSCKIKQQKEESAKQDAHLETFDKQGIFKKSPIISADESNKEKTGIRNMTTEASDPGLTLESNQKPYTIAPTVAGSARDRLKQTITK